LVLDGSEWSALRFCRFKHAKRTPGTHWTGGWVGLRAGLDAVEKRKLAVPGIKPRQSSPQSVAIPGILHVHIVTYMSDYRRGLDW
jgi:hypothetical protein